MGHIDDLVDAYVLGALDLNEVAEVEAHLTMCDQCRALVETAQRVNTLLLYAPPPVLPPSGLRLRVISRVRQEAEQARASEISRPPAATSEDPPRQNLIHWLRSLTRPRPADPVLNGLARLLADPGCTIWEMTGTESLPDAHARFIATRQGSEGVLMANGLAPLSADRAYQVWLLQDGTPIPNVVFQPNADGSMRLLVRAPKQLANFGVIAISAEPTSGSLAPTGAIMLMGALSSV